MSRIGPPAAPGQRVGLLGGSFDPAHAGHLHITARALKALRLDAVWWLVSPGNPLKSDAPAALERRVAAARRLVARPAGDGDRHRGADRHALHRGDADRAQAALPAGALRLADGVGQPRRLPPLGPLADDPRDGAGRRCWRGRASSSAPGCRRRRGPTRAGGCRSGRPRRSPAWRRRPGCCCRGRCSTSPRPSSGRAAAGSAERGPAMSRIDRRTLLLGAAAALAAPALPRRAWAAASAASVASILDASGLGAVSGFAVADLDGGGDAARRARRRRRPAAGLGRQDRHHALRARRRSAPTTASAPGCWRRGRSRAGRCAATWCSRAAATRCSTPTGSAGWWPRCGRAASSASRAGSSSPTAPCPSCPTWRATSRRTPATTRRSRG